MDKRLDWENSFLFSSYHIFTLQHKSELVHDMQTTVQVGKVIRILHGPFILQQIPL